MNKAGGAPFSGSDELLVHMAAGALESVLDASLLTEVAPSPLGAIPPIPQREWTLRGGLEEAASRPHCVSKRRADARGSVAGALRDRAGVGRGRGQGGHRARGAGQGDAAHPGGERTGCEPRVPRGRAAGGRLTGGRRAQMLVMVQSHKLRRIAELSVHGDKGAKAGFIQEARGGESTTDGHLFEPSDGLAGSVLQTRSAVNVANIRREPRFDPRVDLRCGYSGNASLICAPLESSSGTCIGVVQLVKKGVAQFRARDLQLLEVLAVQGGTQLQNRDRHETALRRNVDYSIQVTASLLRCLEVQPSVEVLINRIADRAMHVVACENAVLMLTGTSAAGLPDLWTNVATQEEDIKFLARKAGRTAFVGEKPHKEVRVSRNNGLVSMAFSSRAAVDVPMVLADSRASYFEELSPTGELRNMLLLPVGPRPASRPSRARARTHTQRSTRLVTATNNHTLPGARLTEIPGARLTARRAGVPQRALPGRWAPSARQQEERRDPGLHPRGHLRPPSTAPRGAAWHAAAEAVCAAAGCAKPRALPGGDRPGGARVHGVQGLEDVGPLEVHARLRRGVCREEQVTAGRRSVAARAEARGRVGAIVEASLK